MLARLEWKCINEKKKFNSLLPCHAQTLDYFGSTLCRCLEQSPQLRMIKLSGFPSPTVSVYELYLLILVSLYIWRREREKNSLHSFQIYVIRYGSGSLLFSDDDVNEAKKEWNMLDGKTFTSDRRGIYNKHSSRWMVVKFREFRERERDIMIIGIWNEPEIYKLQLCDIQKWKKKLT